jgi:hypothetical protein
VRDWLILATNLAVDAIDWLALVLIVVGAVEAFFQGLWRPPRARCLAAP